MVGEKLAMVGKPTDPIGKELSDVGHKVKSNSLEPPEGGDNQEEKESCGGDSANTIEEKKQDPSWRRCVFKDRTPVKKLTRRGGGERCKYCRRLMQNSTTIKSGISLSNCSSRNILSARRPLENTLDEVAWACGRLWCSVRRRKTRRVLSLQHQRKKVKIDEAFSTLREILPAEAQPEADKLDSEASKVSTLRLAASYIQALSDLLKDTHLSDSYHKGEESSIATRLTRDSRREDIATPKNIKELLAASKSEDNRTLINKLPIEQV